MDDHQQAYLSQTYFNPITDDYDPIIESYDRGFDDFMLFDGDIHENVFGSGGMAMPLDVLVGSPGLNLSIEEEEGCGRGNSSGTSTKHKRDRSKTVVLERKRRSRMKEKLYELRSLVPNITKMDKASIIGDAVVYVQGLQDEANKLTNEIYVLESSSSSSKDQGASTGSFQNKQAQEHCYIDKCRGKIASVICNEVGDQGRFNVRVECCIMNKGGADGVASSLYTAIESLDCFHMENSSLCCNSDQFVLALSLIIKEAGEMMAASSMKSWVMSALLREGFGFQMTSI